MTTELAPKGSQWVLPPLEAVDPRTTMSGGELVAASRNAFPIVATRQARRDPMGWMAGGGVALLLGGLTFFTMSGHRQPQAPAPVAAPIVAAPVAAPTPPPAAVPPPLMMPSVPSTPLAPAPAAAGQPSPVMVYDGSSAPTTVADATPTAPAPAAAQGGNGGGGSEDDRFAQRVGDDGVKIAGVQAMADPSHTVTQGTLIPAVLETAIDTDLPGYVRALVSRDVRSFDGKNVLIPRSSRLIGQYKSGVAAGQTRAYVIWTRLIRPDGSSVALASPGVDFAGRTGLAGKVDDHFIKRFGSAALLTVVGGLSAIGNPSVVLSGGQSAASVAATRDTSIPPTIRVAQGQPIRVFTARDLDFANGGATAGGGGMSPS